MKLLILNDRRMGHFNQSLALAKLSGSTYTISEVRYKNRWCKWLSYLFDAVGVRSDMLFECTVPEGAFDYVIGAGSTCAYPIKVLASRLGAGSICMMLPKGYRYGDYDLIFAQRHDHPPHRPNIVEIPANFSFSEPRRLFQSEGAAAIGIVIGGNNGVFTLDAERLKRELEQIFEAFAGYTMAVTTSPRTPPEIERLIETFPFDYCVIYSREPVNPIPDFLIGCERVFITQDSTSMISEAVSFGQAYIEILPLEGGEGSKFFRLVADLAKEGYLHRFDGTFGQARKKIDFRRYLAEMVPRGRV